MSPRRAYCRWSQTRLLGIAAGLSFLAALALAHADTAPPRLTSRARPAAKGEPLLEVGEEVKTEAGQKLRVALADGVLFVNERTSLKLDEARRLTLQSGEIFVETTGAAPLVVKTPQREISGRA